MQNTKNFNIYDLLKEGGDWGEPLGKPWETVGKGYLQRHHKGMCPNYTLEDFVSNPDSTYSFKIVLESGKVFKIERKKAKELGKIPHELCIEAMTGKFFDSDISIAEHFPEWIIPDEPAEPRNAFGNLTTPDVYDGGTFIEFKTTIKQDEAKLKAENAVKKFQSRKSMGIRRSLEIGFKVISVSTEKVCLFNIQDGDKWQPSEEICDEMCSMVLLGNAVKTDLEQFGVNLRFKDNAFKVRMMEEMDKTNAYCKENPIECREDDRKYMIDQKLIDYYNAHPEMPIEEVYSIWKMAQNDFVKDAKTMTETEISEKFHKQKERFRRNFEDQGASVQKKTSFKAAIHLPMFIGLKHTSENSDSGDMYVGDFSNATPMCKVFKEGLRDVNEDNGISQTELDEMDKNGKVGVIRDYESGRLVPENALISEFMKARKRTLLKMREGDMIEEMEEIDMMVQGSTDNQTRLNREAIRKRGEQFKFSVNLEETEWAELALRGIESKRYSGEDFMKEKKKESKVPYDYDGTDLSPIDNFVRGENGLFEESDGPKIITGKFRKILEEYNKTRDEMLGSAGREKKQRMGDNRRKKREEMSAEYHLRKYEKLKISAMCQTFTLLIGEVTASLNQMCTPGEFMLKRMSKIGAYLLIKPNKIDGHISFSVLTKRSQTAGMDFNGVFEKWRTYNDDWVYSEFCSVNKHRLSHYLNCNELMCMVSMHLGQIFKDNIENKRIQAHFLGQLLICLESKTPTVIVALLSRYMYMEALKSGMTNRETFKIISKFPEFYRSPLSLWCAKNIVDAAETMAFKNPRVISETSERENENEDTLKSIGTKIEGLISWVTQRPVDDVEQMLYLSYMGVFRNKDEGDPNQGNFVIFGKIMSEELKLYDSSADWRKLGMNSDRENIPHSFRVDAVRSCGAAARRYLEKKYGKKNLDNILEEKILNRWKRNKWEDFSTFSASAVPANSDDWTDHMMKDQRKEKTMNKRAKVMNTVLGMLTGAEPKKEFCSFESMLQAAEASGYQFNVGMEELSPVTMERMKEFHRSMGSPSGADEKFDLCKGQPFENFFKIFKITHDRGYVMSNVFKKAQHTGPREIFVLSVDSRITINFTESVARAICDLLPTEMLTKGTKKISRIEDFFREVNSEKKKHRMPFLVTETDSDDKATWCQQFMMKVFCCLKSSIYNMKSEFFRKLLETESNILNLVTNKKLELPFEMLKDFFEKTGREYDSFNPAMRALKNEFLNENTSHHLIDYQKIYLRNLSNMMQGILHYNSSLLHASFSHYSMEVEAHIIDESLRKIPGNQEYKLMRHLGTLWAVSSDDSLNVRCLGIMKQNFMVDGKEESLIKYAEILLSCLSYLNRRLSRWCCMVHSYEKSTGPNFSGIMEFNSVWKVFSNTLMPTIKYIYASMNLKTTQEMIDRQRGFSESRKQIVENGGKLVECALADILHCKINFKMLGLETNKWFSRYWNLVKMLKSPAFGYYVPELEGTNGLSSFSMNYSLLCSESEEAGKTLSYLYRKADNEFSENGTPTVGVTLAIGGTGNYKNALKKMKPPPDFEATVENDKKFLFRPPNNALESITMIFKKLESAGAVNAFSFNSPYKMFVAGVYCLQSASVTIRMKSSDGWTKFWSSLLGLCIHTVEKIYGNTLGWKSKMPIRKSHEYYTDGNYSEQLDRVFPGRDSFLKFRETSNDLFLYDMMKLDHKLRQTKSTILVTNRTFQTSASLSDCLKHTWFPGQFPRYHTNAEIFQSMQIYSRLFPWCTERLSSIEMNSEKMPFSGWMNFRDFLQSTEVKPNKIFALTAARTADSETTWFNVCRLTVDSRYILVRPGSSVEKIPKKMKKRIELSLNITNNIKTLKEKLDFALILINRYMMSPDSLGDDHANNLKQLLGSIAIPGVIMISPEDIRQLTKEQVTTLLLCNISQSNGNNGDFQSIIGIFEASYKFGVQYRFVSEQSYDEEKGWTGKGDIRLFLDGRPIRITMMDDHLEQLECAEFDVVSGNGHLLCNFLKKRLKMEKANFKRSEMYLDLETGKTVREVTASSRFCPVKINKDLSNKSKLMEASYRISCDFTKGMSIQMSYNDKWIPMYSLKCATRMPTVPMVWSSGYINKGINEHSFKDLSLKIEKFEKVIEVILKNNKGNRIRYSDLIKTVTREHKEAYESFLARLKTERERLKKEITTQYMFDLRINKKKNLKSSDWEMINSMVKSNWKYKHWETSEEYRSFAGSDKIKKLCVLKWLKVIILIKAQSLDTRSKLFKSGRKLEEGDLVRYYDSKDRMKAMIEFCEFLDLNTKKEAQDSEDRPKKALKDEPSNDDDGPEFYDEVWEFYRTNGRFAPNEVSQIRETLTEESYSEFEERLTSEDRLEDVLAMFGTDQDNLKEIMRKLVRSNETLIEASLKSDLIEKKKNLEDEASEVFEEMFFFYFEKLKKFMLPDVKPWQASSKLEEKIIGEYSAESIMEIMQHVTLSSEDFNRTQDFDLDDYLSEKSSVLKVRIKNTMTNLTVFNNSIFKLRNHQEIIGSLCGVIENRNDNLMMILSEIFNNSEVINVKIERDIEF